MKNKVFKIYLLALFIYLFPLISLLMFILVSIFGGADYIYMFFWVLFLTGWLPCGLIGMILFAIGLRKSIKNNDNFNKNLGKAGLLSGLFPLFCGILGLMLIYVVLG
ncbi:MAG: hypothetical protein FWC39_06600 [Bacteroidetes bacterium]|nr:hypothetical protein [Bacteroidota bacterium]